MFREHHDQQEKYNRRFQRPMPKLMRLVQGSFEHPDQPNQHKHASDIHMKQTVGDDVTETSTLSAVVARGSRLCPTNKSKTATSVAVGIRNSEKARKKVTRYKVKKAENDQVVQLLRVSPNRKGSKKKLSKVVSDFFDEDSPSEQQSQLSELDFLNFGESDVCNKDIQGQVNRHTRGSFSQSGAWEPSVRPRSVSAFDDYANRSNNWLN